MNKSMGVLMFVLALVIGLVPLFTDCQAYGRAITTAAGGKVAMKCHWTASAEIGLALPLALIGVFNFISKRKETLLALNLISLVLGALVIAFPTVLIGVCANAAMPCNMIEKPVLLLSGILVIGAGLTVLVNVRRLAGQAAA